MDEAGRVRWHRTVRHRVGFGDDLLSVLLGPWRDALYVLLGQRRGQRRARICRCTECPGMSHARTLVVSQPMFMPWVGLFEQVRLADVFIHYDDVQLPQGRSFVSRVQIKVPTGVMWLSAPLDRKRSGRAINEVLFASRADWRRK